MIILNYPSFLYCSSFVTRLQITDVFFFFGRWFTIWTFPFSVLLTLFFFFLIWHVINFTVRGCWFERNPSYNIWLNDNFAMKRLLKNCQIYLYIYIWLVNTFANKLYLKKNLDGLNIFFFSSSFFSNTKQNQS